MESIENKLKYEFPEMYETHPELIRKFYEEYTDVIGDSPIHKYLYGFETLEDLMCFIQSRLMEHFETHFNGEE